MKNIILILFACLAVKTNAQDFKWVKQIKVGGSIVGNSITTDAQGYVYITGSFRGTMAVQPQLVSTVQDIFVQKRDANGAQVWKKQMSGSNDAGNSITTDAKGNVYVTGGFSGTATFGTKTLTAKGTGSLDPDIFVQKLDEDGKVLWAKKMGGSGFDTGNSIATDADGNVYITGFFNGTATFGTKTLTAKGTGSPPFPDIFVQKLNAADGTVLWAKQMGGSSSDIGNSITTDAKGNVYVTGGFSGTATFGKDAKDKDVKLTAASSGTSDIFVQKLDKDGTVLWAQKTGEAGNDIGKSITTDVKGNVYITGFFDGKGTGAKLTSSNIFIQKLNAEDGNLLWIKKMGGASKNIGNSIATNASGNIYITGAFSGTVDFDPDTSKKKELKAAGVNDIFIQKLNPSGELMWARGIGGTQEDMGNAITIDVNGDVCITGAFKDKVDFDPTTLDAIEEGIFVLKLTTVAKTITVTGKSNKSTINIFGGTLQMEAVTDPLDAVYTWSVDKPEIATISKTGVLKAVTNGTVIVTATATARSKNGKEVKGTKTITISKQIKEITLSEYRSKTTNQKITYEVKDKTKISSAYVYWQNISALNLANPKFNKKKLEDIDGDNTYAFNISSTLGALEDKTQLTGIVYYAEFENTSAGTTKLEKNYLPITYSAVGVSNVGFGKKPENYRLMATPIAIKPNENTVKNIFKNVLKGASYDNEKMRIYTYSNPEKKFIEASGSTEIKQGIGYFVLIANPTAILFPEGVTSFKKIYKDKEERGFTIDLKPGWNLIGNPFLHDINWADIIRKSNMAGTEVDQLFIYTDKWETPASGKIGVGQGAFVHNSTDKDFELKIPVFLASNGRRAPVLENRNALINPSWQITFRGTSNNGHPIMLGGIGMEEDANYSKDKYDLLNPPSFGNEKTIKFAHPEFMTPSFKKDVRKTSLKNKWSFSYITNNSTNKKQTISWDNSYFGANAPNIYLVNKTHFGIVNMKKDSTYTFNHAKTTALEIYYGYEKLENILPQKSIIQTPFPNPFVDAVTFNFSIPQDGNRTIFIKIINTIGKTIKVISTKDTPSAYGSISWNGTDANGKFVSKGIYIYRMYIEGEGTSLNLIKTGKIIKK